MKVRKTETYGFTERPKQLDAILDTSEYVDAQDIRALRA